ncbi:hypothetical protein BDK51DRAFT_51306 [Blyttiomyces helicus]|uniref:Uncharacterized protein n=1 Tax=Blyttiomyces helicus TaxID=388810 RepID=A0A4P9WP45_9FUNG|nr:hypothetical protein BDK51DRAFT_51306 [Blyttiomyces helicus]|eukprot:RKO94075.1 hypothetical protein BDK51DRAFT_51306 [Blyttiomyces helicus]
MDLAQSGQSSRMGEQPPRNTDFLNRSNEGAVHRLPATPVSSTLSYWENQQKHLQAVGGQMAAGNNEGDWGSLEILRKWVAGGGENSGAEGSYMDIRTDDWQQVVATGDGTAVAAIRDQASPVSGVHIVQEQFPNSLIEKSVSHVMQSVQKSTLSTWFFNGFSTQIAAFPARNIGGGLRNMTTSFLRDLNKKAASSRREQGGRHPRELATVPERTLRLGFYLPLIILS